jgi:hypothetical protein
MKEDWNEERGIQNFCRKNLIDRITWETYV